MEDGYPIAKARLRLVWGKAANEPKQTLENNRLRECDTHSVGAGLPAKQATRWMAPALPVLAGEPAPTRFAAGRSVGYGS